MGIGVRLEAIMKAKSINANELAKRVGATSSTIYSMIKRDSNRVDIDLIIKIAHALGMTGFEPAMFSYIYAENLMVVSYFVTYCVIKPKTAPRVYPPRLFILHRTCPLMLVINQRLR